MEEEKEVQMGEDLTGKNLLGMSLLSFLFYIVLSLVLIYFLHDGSIWTMFEHGYSIPVQVVVGLGAGVIAALVVMQLSAKSPIADVLNDYALFRVIANTRFSSFDRVQISLFAGAGEEILFRGAIQPIIGIWATSILFIAIHGYFKFTSFGHILFGVMMFALSMLLGLLFETTGLVSAMIAHAVYDLVMLKNVDKLGR